MEKVRKGEKMYAKERRNLIRKEILEVGKVVVKELSEKYSVSEVIIRKDLKKLEEEENSIERTHGGAILKRKNIPTISLSSRKVKNRQEKELIVEKVYDEIEDGEILLLDTSSITRILAEKLALKPKKVIIVTNMLEILLVLSPSKDIKLISLGGTYNHELGGFIGSLTTDNLSKYNVDKSFIGAGGISLENGNISNFNEEEGRYKELVINSSKKSYLLAEKEKFYRDGIYNFSKLENIDYIITGEEFTSEEENRLKEHKVKPL